MKVLFWIPPWAIDNDALYFKNVFLKHLAVQANLLAEKVIVDFALPTYYMSEKSCLTSKINIIELPLESDYLFSVAYEDIYCSIYKNEDEELIDKLATYFKSYLVDKYDVILTWENPVPYLQKIFPTALIINQMPGIFSRPPYPHTVIFDPVGLYNNGILSVDSKKILTGYNILKSDLELAEQFKNMALISLKKTEMSCISEEIAKFSMKGQSTKLLPLQTSYHYAFKGDTNYKNQRDFLYDVLNENNGNNVVITQYVSRLYQDTPLNQTTYSAIKYNFENAYYSEAFDKVASVSQYLLLYSDTVISASSSIGLQGFCLGKGLEVKGDTFQKNYETKLSHTINNAPENTLAFILNYHQVLASKILYDAQFLFELISGMLEKKNKGAQGIDILINYSELDKNYHKKVLSEFRINNTQAFNLKNVSDTCIEEQQFLNKFIESIYDDQVQVISFDIFDTLIKRGVEKPVDVYKLMDSDVNILTGGMISKFSRYRAAAEVEARKLYINNEEISLQNIYDTMAQMIGIHTDILIPIMEYEIQKEISVISCREFGMRLYNLALQTKKEVVLISDMYHSMNVIKDILQAVNINGYSKLYVSSEYNATKKTGNLYKLVALDLNVDYKNILHIGDNKQTDINSAKNLGIQAIRWSSAIEWMRTNILWKNIYNPRTNIGTKERSILAGITALGMFDEPRGKSSFESLTGGEPYRFGYSILGPMLLGYMLWLHKEATSKNISDLYFLSREGFILKEVFDILFPSDTYLIKTHYLYCSRRAVRVSSLFTQNDIFALAAEPYTEGVTIKSLLENRFGIVVNNDRLNKKLSRSADDLLLWNQTCLEFEEEILCNSEIEREKYVLYLNNMGVSDASNPAIVDVGWGGNMQGYLSRLLNKNIYGFYYATLSSVELWQKQGIFSSAYLGENLPGYYRSPVIQNRHLFEYVICHSDPSFISVKTIHDDEILFNFRTEENLSLRKNFITQLHEGVKNYSREFIQHFSIEKETIVIDPVSAELAFSYFINNPSVLDAKLFQNKVFEDAVGGVEQKFIIAPDGKNIQKLSVWSEGAQLLYDQKFPKKKAKDNVKPKAIVSSESKIIVNDITERPIETWVMKQTLSEKKLDKYLSNRKKFFLDSKSKIVHFYYNLVRD